jgi:DNA repair exonuclease SbcCD nuclease subunit
MIGSLIQQNFGETIKHHGYGIYDIETDEYTFHDLTNEQPFLHFSISDITDIENEKEKLLNIG